jgi:tight adherence protein B
VVIRRICAAGGAALAMVLAAAGPARAHDALTVTVAAVTPGHVQLTAFADTGSAGPAPVVTVSYDGTVLPSAAEVVRAAASTSEARAVVVVLDTGGSMAGDALRVAEDAVLGFARAVPADVQVGLVTVADTPSVRVRPTRDRAAIGSALSSVHAAGRTDLYSGVGTATDLVAGYADRRVLVVSDGRGAISGAGAATMVQAVTAAGTRVDVVAFRAAPDRLESLRQLVTATGGTAYPSANPDALAGALNSAAASSPSP